MWVILRQQENLIAMMKTDNNIRHDGQRRKTGDAQQFLEDRTELLDTIREMINVEMDRRGACIRGRTMYGKPPPEPKPRKLSFLRWIKSLF